jgi:diadenylate cyclase
VSHSPDSPEALIVSTVPASPLRTSFSAHVTHEASDLMKRVGASVVMILAESMNDWQCARGSQVKFIVASMTEKIQDAARECGLTVIELEPLNNSIADRISLSLIEAVSMDLVGPTDLVVVVYGGFESGVLDSISVVRLGEHLEKLKPRDLRELETNVPFETLKCVVDVATEIGREGREGTAVGTLIVVGDHRNVMQRTRPMGFDPFKGYPRRERNIKDFRVREAIKEIAQLDGAIIVSRDGTVEAGCRLVDAPVHGLALPKGLGTRHWAAAAITAVTRCVAVVVSQSTGTVRLFRDGEVILRVSPMRRARAMKWTDQETEPPPSGSRTE